MHTQSEAQTPSDVELVEGILKRDTRAFEQLFDRYAEPLQRHVSYIVHDTPSAHDVVQETFLRVWNRTAQWEGSGTFRAWLYRIATNLALNHLRTRKRRREVPLELPREPDDDDAENFIPAWAIDDASQGPEEVVERSEQRSTYKRLVGQLDEDKRNVVRMVLEMEMSIRDTADALDIPEGTVKSRLHYARRTLAREWREWETDDE